MSAQAGSLRLFAWDRPEWWSLGLSAAAWTLVVASSHEMHVHQHGAVISWAAGTEQWTLMTVAMMFPLLIEPVRITAARSFWHRRNRAIAGFLLGYLGSWIVPGLIASAAVTLLRGRLPTAWLAASGFMLASLWQFTRWKRLGLRLCHQTRPLAPIGWRADRDCILYGAMIARACMLSCGGLMAACALAGHAMSAMVVATAIAFLQRKPAAPGNWMMGAALACIALLAVASSR